jgi:SAM-dependent methyltransferase
MIQTQKVARRFDARAHVYDNPLTAYIGEMELQKIRALVPEGCPTLDYGCGTGRTTLDLLERRCLVTAFDISVEMQTRAQDKVEAAGYSAQFVVDAAELEGLTWPMVTCIGVLDYYKDPLPLLRTLKSFLEPGGRLVVTVPNALSPLGWLYRLGSRFTVPAFLKTPDALETFAEQAGLAVYRISYAFPSIAPLGHTIVAGLCH